MMEGRAILYSEIEKMRTHAREIFLEAVRSVDPYVAVKRCMRMEDNQLLVAEPGKEPRRFNLREFKNIFVVGGGKATAPMARAVEEILGTRISKGHVVVKYGFVESLEKIEITEASHPLPDENGVEGTKKILDILEQAGEGDLVISLISGGGSALLPQPADRITLEEKQAVTQMLLDCGATIEEINAVRKHISLTKGGQMARVASPATVVNLMLSDVVGDRLDVIASGPFVPDPSTFKTVEAIVKKYKLESLPTSVAHYIKAGLEGRIPETPKKGDEAFGRVFNLVVGSNIIALKAAEQKASSLGYNAMILSSMIEGETREVAKVHVGIAREVLKTGHPIGPDACIISGGETTVTIRGQGLGGRNQEFCLAAAMELSSEAQGIVILSGGTDGNDGPTDAAGGIVDSFTVKRGQNAGLDPMEFLENNDSYNFLKKTGDLLITGPTNTNVMDVRLILIRRLSTS